MDKQTLYVILPCFNEGENIESLIYEWKRQQEKLERSNIHLQIIAVDDGSNDSTLWKLLVVAKSMNNLIILDHKENKGLGETLNTGINHALSFKNASLICIMDADMTHEPLYIFSMLDKLKNAQADCVIASRCQRGSKIQGLSFYRRLLSFCASILYRLKFRIPNVKDYTCGYRLYNAPSLRILFAKYQGKIINERGFACSLELLLKLHKCNLKIVEVPFILKYQLKKGLSKMKIFKTIYRSLILLSKYQKG